MIRQAEKLSAAIERRCEKVRSRFRRSFNLKCRYGAGADWIRGISDASGSAITV
jgi:hypothetical protein